MVDKVDFVYDYRLEGLSFNIKWFNQTPQLYSVFSKALEMSNLLIRLTLNLDQKSMSRITRTHTPA